MNQYQLIAARSAAKLCAEKTGCILDTETTGFRPEDRICDIAIIDFDGNVLLDSLVNPEMPMPEGARAIHGISDDMLRDAPTWPALHVRVMEILYAHQPVVIYNAPFDNRLLEQSAGAYGLSAARKIRGTLIATKYESHCAMQMYSHFIGEVNHRKGGFKWHKLTDAARRCNVDAGNAHRALADVITTLGVLRFMAAAYAREVPIWK